MNILITGAKGMVGTALINNLKTIQNKTNTTRPNLTINEIYSYDIGDEDKLDYYCSKCDFVFNLAGINRPDNIKDFYEGNYGFTTKLLESLKKHNNKSPIMLSSSIQATLVGRYANSDYGKSKLDGENYLFDYSKENNVKVFVYRFVNLMGHSRPYYNSAVSTFCYAIANDKEYVVNDYNTEIELLYIDDLVNGMFDLLEGKEIHCDYNGLEPIINKNGKYCIIPTTYKVTLGKIIDLLKEFDSQPQTLLMPSIPDNSFEKKLYSLYLTYLPKEKFSYKLKMNVDDRGSFTELLHSNSFGQVSVNISKPGITKGNHWHNSKWEYFIVVSGHGKIVERNINTNEIVEFEVSGDNIQVVTMIPGWTHSIINLSSSENLVTIMTCNEIFNKDKPDTYFEKVKNE